MKFSIKKEDVSHLVRAASSISVEYINFSINKFEDKHICSIYLSDKVHSITAKAYVKSSDEFNFVIKHQLFCDALKNINAEVVDFSINDSSLGIKYGALNFNLNLVADYPVRSSGDIEFKMHSVDINKFKSALSNVMSSAILSEYVENFTHCILMEFSDNNISFVATDAHRLSISDAKIFNDKAYEAKEILLSKKSANAIKKILYKNDNNWKIGFDNLYIYIQNDDIDILISQASRDYPDYKSIIKTYITEAIIDKSLLISGMNAVTSILSSSEDSIYLTFKESSITISTKGYNGNADNNIDVKYDNERCYKDDISIHLSIKYLRDAINSCTGDTINISINNGYSEIIISCNDNDITSKHLIMPKV